MKTILINPNAKVFYNNKLFDTKDDLLNIAHALDPFFFLRQFLKKKGYDVKTIDKGDPEKADKIIFLDIEHFDPYLKKCISLNLKDKMVLILMESSIIKPHQYKRSKHKYFSKILTWNPSLIDNKKYFQFYLPEYLETNYNPTPFNSRKFICMINSNKFAVGKEGLYDERKKAVLSLEKQGITCDVYGAGWNQHQCKVMILLHSIKNIHRFDLKRFLYLLDFMFNIKKIKNYKSTTLYPSKVLNSYKFAICYENSITPGYVSEKIFNCFNARCVPIYWGAPDIEQYIPKGTFIDRRDFKDETELLKFLQSMDEKQYLKYLKQIDLFLKSNKAKLFGYQNFSEIVYRVIIS